MKQEEAAAYIRPLVTLLEDHEGEENALPESGAAAALGLTTRDFRDVRALAEEEHPIASTGKGIFKCVSYDDYDHPLRWRMARLKAEARAFSKLRKCRNNHFPQKQPRLLRVRREFPREAA